MGVEPEADKLQVCHHMQNACGATIVPLPTPIINTTPTTRVARPNRFFFVYFYFFKTACTEIGGGSVRRTDMTFLDFWSTSSALYEPAEGSKDAGTVPASFEPSSGA
jgi:hypothetical protein